jgi:hypothetical protein
MELGSIDSPPIYANEHRKEASLSPPHVRGIQARMIGTFGESIDGSDVAAAEPIPHSNGLTAALCLRVQDGAGMDEFHVQA